MSVLKADYTLNRFASAVGTYYKSDSNQTLGGKVMDIGSGEGVRIETAERAWKDPNNLAISGVSRNFNAFDWDKKNTYAQYTTIRTVVPASQDIVDAKNKGLKGKGADNNQSAVSVGSNASPSNNYLTVNPYQPSSKTTVAPTQNQQATANVQKKQPAATPVGAQSTPLVKDGYHVVWEDGKWKYTDGNKEVPESDAIVPIGPPEMKEITASELESSPNFVGPPAMKPITTDELAAAKEDTTTSKNTDTDIYDAFNKIAEADKALLDRQRKLITVQQLVGGGAMVGNMLSLLNGAPPEKSMVPIATYPKTEYASLYKPQTDQNIASLMAMRQYLAQYGLQDQIPGALANPH